MTNRTMQRETVVGVFNNRWDAQRAIEDLKATGFRAEDIGILMQNKEGAERLAADTGTEAGEGAAAGAVTGGVLGGLAGLLVGLGALAIPGIGPVLAAGPLAAALGPILGATATGAVIGAGTGAIAGALIGLGIPDAEAHIYEERFNAGRILVTVKAGARRYNEAWEILRRDGAEALDFSRGAPYEDTAYRQGQVYGQGQATTNSGQTWGQGPSYGQATTEGSESFRVPVVEETLTANKGVREAGQVEVRKHVVEEQINLPVEVSHEEVIVERHATNRPLQAGERVLDDGEVIRVPVREETVDVQKQAQVTGEVEIRKQKVTGQRNFSDTVRREEVDVNTSGNVEARNRGSAETTDTTYTQDTQYREDVDTNYNPNP